MEDSSIEDVKVLASDWVKRMQNSVPTPNDDLRNYGVVRARFGSNDERMLRSHDFCEENGKIDDFNLHLTNTARAGFTDSPRQLSVDAGRGRDVFEQYDTSFERTSKQSNSAHSSRTTGGREEILTREASSNVTPRVDVSFLRQKRLAFFDDKLRSQEEGDILHDKNSNILTKIAVNHSRPSEAHSSSSSEEFDFSLLRSNGFATQESSDQMYGLQLAETPIPSHFINGSDHDNCVKYPCMSPRVRVPDHEPDEEDIKLELWGLKEAVQSGEVDLNVYLKRPAWRDQNVSDSTTYMYRRLGKENCDMQSSEELPRNGFDPLLHDKTKPVILPDSGGYKQSHFHSVVNESGKIWKEISDDVDDGYFSKEHRTSFSPVFHMQEGSHVFNGPEPQINGPLYSGFETSDSESSLLSFGSKCDDVHYRKVVKKQDSPVVDKRLSQRTNVLSASKKKENKIKPKRSKDKILMELTEFIEGSGTPKDVKHSRQSTRSNDVAKVNNAHVQEGNVLTTVLGDHLHNGFAERADAVNLNGNSSYMYKTNVCDKNVVQSCDDYNQRRDGRILEENQGSVMGKICPKCSEVNSKAANWCIECGTALVCVKASCLTPRQQNHFEKQCLETQALIKETLKTPMNLSQALPYDKAAKEERSLSNDISNLSLQVSQSTSNLEESKYSSSPHGYKRRWMRSSIAWNTFHSSELSKSPSFVKEHDQMKDKKRATSFSDLVTHSSTDKGNKHRRNSRSKSARQRTVSCSSVGPDEEATSACGRLTIEDHKRPQTTSLKGTQKEKQSRTYDQRSSSSLENKNGKTTKGQHKANLRNGFISIESQSSPSLLKVFR